MAETERVHTELAALRALRCEGLRVDVVEHRKENDHLQHRLRSCTAMWHSEHATWNHAGASEDDIEKGVNEVAETLGGARLAERVVRPSSPSVSQEGPYSTEDENLRGECGAGRVLEKPACSHDQTPDMRISTLQKPRHSTPNAASCASTRNNHRGHDHQASSPAVPAVSNGPGAQESGDHGTALSRRTLSRSVYNAILKTLGLLREAESTAMMESDGEDSNMAGARWQMETNIFRRNSEPQLSWQQRRGSTKTLNLAKIMFSRRQSEPLVVRADLEFLKERDAHAGDSPSLSCPSKFGAATTNIHSTGSAMSPIMRPISEDKLTSCSDAKSKDGARAEQQPHLFGSLGGWTRMSSSSIQAGHLSSSSKKRRTSLYAGRAAGDHQAGDASKPVNDMHAMLIAIQTAMMDWLLDPNNKSGSSGSQLVKRDYTHADKVGSHCNRDP
jgi:hypothetical protein